MVQEGKNELYKLVKSISIFFKKGRKNKEQKIYKFKKDKKKRLLAKWASPKIRLRIKGKQSASRKVEQFQKRVAQRVNYRKREIR